MKLFLLQVAQEFYSIKLTCRNLYTIFLHLKNVCSKNGEGGGKLDLDLDRLIACNTSLYSIKKTRTHLAKQRDNSFLKKFLVSRNDLSEIENIYARDLDV